MRLSPNPSPKNKESKKIAAGGGSGSKKKKARKRGSGDVKMKRAPRSFGDVAKKIEEQSVQDSKKNEASESQKKKDSVVIFTLGSANIRVGLSSETTPSVVPCCVAFRKKKNKNTKKKNKNTKEEKKADGEAKQQDAASPYELAAGCHSSSGSAAGADNKGASLDSKAGRKRQREEVKRSIEDALQKRRKTGKNVPRYGKGNCTTSVPEDISFWLTTSSGGGGGDGDGDGDLPAVVVGEDVLKVPNLSEEYTVFRPIRRGVLNVTDGTIEMVRSALYHLLFRTLKEKLGLDPKAWGDHTVMMAIPPRFSSKEVSVLLDLVFRDLKFEKLFLHQEAVLSCYGAGVATACVVDVGAQKTHICCVSDGSVVPLTEINLDFGGDDIDETLFWLLGNDEKNFFPLTGEKDSAGDSVLDSNPLLREEVRKLKKKHCLFSAGGNKLETQKCEILERRPGQDARRHKFNIETAALVAPRALFEPSLFPDPKPYFRIPGSMESSDNRAKLFLKGSGYLKYSKEARKLEAEKSLLLGPKGRSRLQKDGSRLGIHVAAARSISRLTQTKERTTMTRKILMAGGSTMFKGMYKAIIAEMENTIPADSSATKKEAQAASDETDDDATDSSIEMTLQPKGPGAKVIDPKHVTAEDLCWTGLYVLSQGEFFQGQVVKRKDYLEHGFAAIREQIPFPL